MHRGLPRKALSAFLVAAAATLSFGSFAAPAETLTVEQIATLSGPDRDHILQEGARTEGKVVLYSGMIVDQALRPLVAAFQTKYPFVKLDFWREDSTQILQKVLAERRANAQQVDVLEWGGGVPTAIRAGLIQPFRSPTLSAYPAEDVDPKGNYAATRFDYYGTAFNTKLVSDDAVPKNYEDLLDSKWRDKISWPIAEQGSLEFIMHVMMFMGDEKGEAYLQKLSTQRLVAFTGSARALVDRVGQGEVPLAIQIYAHHPLISKAKGAPLDVQMMDPVAVDFSAIQLVKGAPHPYGAMLLIDFILSEDGQRVLQKADYLPANPAISPSESLRKIVPRLSGHTENVISPEAYFSHRDQAVALYEKYFDK
jgi:ABC-type Fe3+ transport system substrate-binding protein